MTTVKIKRKKPIDLYRIVTIQRALDIFENNVLGLVKPSSWKDPFESYLSKVKFIDVKGEEKHIEYLDNVYGLCFSLNRESSLMWDAYTPYKNGIRLKISLEKLVAVLKSQRELRYSKFTYRKVNYVQYRDFISRLDDEKSLRKIYKNQNSALIDYLFIKRREYRDEREFRLIYNANGTEIQVEKILYLQIKPNDLIEGIRFDPKMPETDCKTLKNYFAKKGFDKRKIVRSLLYDYQIKKKVRLLKIKV